MTKRQVKRDAARRANAKPLWEKRRDLADRSPVEAPVVAFDLARKRVKAIRDQSERDLRWRQLADLINDFASRLGSQPREFTGPEADSGLDLDPGARPRARESTDGHTPSAREEEK